MLKSLHENKKVQLIIGLVLGIFFGFFLQKGGVTNYNIIIGQLILTDFTVFKVMLSAVIVGMLGVYLLRSLGFAQLHLKQGSIGSTVIGGLIFGVGFAVLGYCPGTAAGAVGQGSLDALFGGVVGMLIGTGLFAAMYPKLQRKILNKGYFGDVTFPQLLKVNPWVVVITFAILLTAFLFWMENIGL
ncbi:MAG: YeeE/YedE thiosulfate transporter family protein [Methanocellales archaeon]|nr:YeeE/YedE thiosulfate transporter family protein [Methanocellales archaeon]MDD4898297.1 YeeE/YedE thiosulfate transporter family protein [Methanocellales archaeon]MDD5447203.1 YeeE/YedE thiosulfate transporter family protein [Methanocellales archaeon]